MKYSVIAPSLEEEVRYAIWCVSRMQDGNAHLYKSILPAGIHQNSTPAETATAVINEFPAKQAALAAKRDEITAAVTSHMNEIDAFLAKTFTLFIPDEITVAFTSYGRGGSYNVIPPRIIIREPSPGANPLHTVIHETVHIIIEQPVIQTHIVPLALGNAQKAHGMKETMVDTICQGAEFLTGYKSQPFNEVLPTGWEKLLTPTSLDSIRS